VRVDAAPPPFDPERHALNTRKGGEGVDERGRRIEVGLVPREFDLCRVPCTETESHRVAGGIVRKNPSASSPVVGPRQSSSSTLCAGVRAPDARRSTGVSTGAT
jgi:hypothetical protein